MLLLRGYARQAPASPVNASSMQCFGKLLLVCEIDMLTTLKKF